MPLHDFRSICLPYCIERQQDGTYVALNREYKPIGFGLPTYVDYSHFPVGVAYSGITPKFAAKVSARGDSGIDCIFLYNDGCIPTDGAEHMAAYMKRLAALAKLKVKPMPHYEEKQLVDAFRAKFPIVRAGEDQA